MAQKAGDGGLSALPSIKLTELENKLAQLLTDVAAFVNPTQPSELRFTGGWVRDKLLGIESKDIDVGINDMTGYNFGLKMEEYLAIPGNAEKHGLNRRDADGANATEKDNLLGGLHKIEANPEKSKHLETVTTKVFGLDIDLVNLRKETYTEESRNPQMEFGTPEEDALRRDATINALFYNLRTKKVEDFTERGIDDMAAGIIRTPLEPYQTFKDDPLRVLRLVRFASRLQYSLDPPAQESMADDSIREALRAKISRERIGVELEKMLKGTKIQNAHLSLSLIDNIGLYTTIFTDPTSQARYTPEATWFRSAIECVSELHAAHEHIQRLLAPDSESQYLLWLLSTFVPLAEAPAPTAKPGKKAPPTFATNVAREGIKAANKICDVVEASVVHLEDIIAVKDKFVRRKNGESSPELLDADRRDTLGMHIRKWGSTWKLQVAYAIMVESARLSKTDINVFSRYQQFLKHIENLDLLEAYDFKPVVDGKTLAQALDTKPGPWMKEALDVVMAWQLQNPESATKEGAIQAVKEKHGELAISLLDHFLQLTLRPLFSKTQTHNVTAAGHKKTVGQARSFELDDDLEKRPWKKEANAYALSLFAWVLQALNPQLTERFWPLLIPPMFALLDDMDAGFKAKGCDMFVLLMEQTPPSLLKRTGLGKVFEDAISPCLSYLPGLTPEDESLLLLGSAFPAIFSLYNVQYPKAEDTKTSTKRISTDHITAVNSLLHETILPSIEHLKDKHPKIVTLLLHQMGHVVGTLGIHSVSHLKDTVASLVSIMVDPYATGDLDMLQSCVKTQQLVIANAWPRVYFWRSDMLKGICTAWVRVCEDEQELTASKSTHETQEARKLLLGNIKGDLSRAGKLLASAIEGTQSMAGEDAELTDREAVLAVDFKADFQLFVEGNASLQQLHQSVFSK